MKKFLFIAIALLMVGVGLFAQEVQPPTDLINFFMGLQIFLGSFVGVAVSLPVLTAIVIGALKIEDKVLKYIMTALVAVVLVLASFFLPFGYLNGAVWWFVPLHVAGLMLIEVIGFSIPFIKTVLEAIEDKFKPAPIF